MIFSSPESALNALKTLSKDKQILIDYRNDCDVLRAKIESISSPTLSSEPHNHPTWYRRGFNRAIFRYAKNVTD